MSKELTPLEAFQLFCKELKIENSEFANAIEAALKRLALFDDENVVAYLSRSDEKKLKALEIIKKHILSRDMDTSGIYLEFHNGHYEPYYTIEIKEGIKQIVSPEEYDLLKEVLL